MMSHQPTIPEAARSPFPIQPPPASQKTAAPADAEDNREPEAPDASQPGEQGESWTDRVRDNFEGAARSKVGLGAAVGIGSAALLAALLYARRGSAAGRTSAAQNKRGGERARPSQQS
jgi:hypothetical protein